MCTIFICFSKKRFAFEWVSRWLMMFLIGIGTSLLAAGVHISVELVAHHKFLLIGKCILCHYLPSSFCCHVDCFMMRHRPEISVCGLSPRVKSPLRDID